MPQQSYKTTMQSTLALQQQNKIFNFTISSPDLWTLKRAVHARGVAKHTSFAEFGLEH